MFLYSVSIEFPSIIQGYGRNVQPFVNLSFGYGYGRDQKWKARESWKMVEKLKTILLFFVRDFPSLEAFVVHAIIIGSYNDSMRILEIFRP